MESSTPSRDDLPATQPQAPMAYPQGLPVGSPYTAFPEEAEGNDGIRLTSFLHSFRRQWLPALGLGMILATLFAVLLWFIIPVEFQAIAVLRINRDEAFGNRRYATINDYVTYKETQAALLKSPLVMAAALRDNDIAQLSMVRFDELGRKRERPIAWLADEVKVDLAGGSELIRVRFSGRDKMQTEKILNAVVEAYKTEIVNKERLQRQDLLDDLRARYRFNMSDLEKRSDEIQELAKQVGSTNSQDIVSEQTIRLREMQSAKGTLDSLVKEYNYALSELQLLQLNAQMGNATPTEYAIEDELEQADDYYASLSQQIRAIQDRLEAVAEVYRPGAGQLTEMQQQLAFLRRRKEDYREEVKPRIVARLISQEGETDQDKQRQLLMQRARVQSLATQVQRAQEGYQMSIDRVRELGGFTGRLDAKLQELSALKKDTGSMRSEIQDLEIELEAPERIVVVQEATTPNDSNWRLKLGEVMGAWLLALGCVVCGVAYWDYLGKRVNNSEDLSRASTIRVVGSLPAIQHSGMISFLKPGRDKLEQAMHVSVDAIRAALLYNRGLKTQVVMVTSATGQEGRSTVASQLAVSMARAGKTTLLVDGDIRSPQQQLIFGIDAPGGFCEMLRGQLTADQAVVATAIENVWLLPAGRCDQIALQGLSGDRAKEILRELRERFDCIILDCSPVLTSSDALLLGQHVDAALLSVRRDVSQTPKINAACDRLSSVGVEVLGAVLNGMDVELRRGELAVSEETEESKQPALTNA